MFGSTSTPFSPFGTSTATPSTPSGFSFGASTPATPAASTPFGFGGTTPSSPFGTTLGAPATPSAFGGTLGAPASPFGTSLGTAAPTPSLFGTSSTPVGSSPSLFGGASMPFGAAPATPAPSMFGGSSTPFGMTPALGSLTTGAAPMWGQPAAAVASVRPSATTPLQKIKDLMDAWNRASPDCRFRHMLYNRVPTEDVDKYGRPADVNEKLWTQAIDANWDPKHLVPVQATGFGDLQQRIVQQQTTTQQQEQLLEEVRNYLRNTQSKHDLDLNVKIDEAKRRQMQLSHRLMAIMKKIEVLCSKGYPIVGDEDVFRNKLEILANALSQPNHFKNRLTELQASIRMQEDRPAEQLDPIDPDALESLKLYLAQQTEGLAHLTSILQKDLRDISLVTNSLNQNPH